MSDLFDTVTQIIRDVLGQDDLVLTPQTSARDVDGWSSMRNIEIVVACEIKFGIQFGVGDIEELNNVGDFVALIGIRLEEKKKWL